MPNLPCTARYPRIVETDANDLLFLVHRIPYPPEKGDKLRSYHLLQHLSRQFRVHLGCFVDDPGDWQHLDSVRRYCGETLFLPLSPGRRRIASLSAMLSDEPLSLAYYRDPQMSHWVNRIVRRYEVGRVVVFSSVMAQYAKHITRARRVADMVDVDSAKWAQYADEKPWPLSWVYRREARTLLAFEAEVARSFDASVFVSQAEADLFRRLSGIEQACITVAENGVDTDYFKPGMGSMTPFDAGTRALVFTGAMDYWPNADAVNWFATEVFPHALNRWPELRFVVVGARPTAAVRALAERPGIVVTGRVPDVRPYMEHALAIVAPLRVARGVQNKVLEGMAMERTVIASPDAAMGIDARADVEILVASDPVQYLAAIAAVRESGRDLGAAARERILRSYSWPRNLQRINDLLGTPSEASDATGARAAATV